MRDSKCNLYTVSLSVFFFCFILSSIQWVAEVARLLGGAFIGCVYFTLCDGIEKYVVPSARYKVRLGLERTIVIGS